MQPLTCATASATPTPRMDLYHQNAPAAGVRGARSPGCKGAARKSPTGRAPGGALEGGIRGECAPLVCVSMQRFYSTFPNKILLNFLGT
jgi:hypothetical protein